MLPNDKNQKPNLYHSNVSAPGKDRHEQSLYSLYMSWPHAVNHLCLQPKTNARNCLQQTLDAGLKTKKKQKKTT